MYTIKDDVTNEIIIKNSKFICVIYKTYNINDIDIYINKIKEIYKDATHYCYAYIINNNQKFSDDGEPSGTAGSPIMQVLEKNKLNYILCVVIRYFGGIKLGAGGLVRAYTKSVCECLKKTNINKLIQGYNVDIIFDYNQINTVDYILKNHSILLKKFEDNVTYNLNIDNNFYNDLIKIKDLKINILKKVQIETN